MVSRFLAKQRSGEYRVSISQQELTAHDVASRILRRENFLIALIDRGVLDLRPVVPFVGAWSRLVVPGVVWCGLVWSCLVCVCTYMCLSHATPHHHALLGWRGVAWLWIQMTAQQQP